MGRLSREIEVETEEFYASRNGFLVNISDFGEAERISSLIDDYCQSCQKCLAGNTPISLGEIGWQLRGSGLSAVGLLEIRNKEQCPLFLALHTSEPTLR